LARPDRPEVDLPIRASIMSGAHGEWIRVLSVNESSSGNSKG